MIHSRITLPQDVRLTAVEVQEYYQKIVKPGGKAYNNQGQLPKGDEVITIVLLIDPKDRAQLNNWGQVLAALDGIIDTDEAQIVLEEIGATGKTLTIQSKVSILLTLYARSGLIKINEDLVRELSLALHQYSKLKRNRGNATIPNVLSFMLSQILKKSYTNA